MRYKIYRYFSKMNARLCRKRKQTFKVRCFRWVSWHMVRLTYVPRDYKVIREDLFAFVDPSMLGEYDIVTQESDGRFIRAKITKRQE